MSGENKTKEDQDGKYDMETVWWLLLLLDADVQEFKYLWNTPCYLDKTRPRRNGMVNMTLQWFFLLLFGADIFILILFDASISMS